MTKLSALALVLTATAIGTAHAAPRSIVGMWKPVGQQCTPAAGAMSIQPMSVTWDEYACDFGSVARKGSTVTWKGSCLSPQGDRDRTVVVATERSGRLSVAINGHRDETVYQRCSKGEF